jgi:serine/threonine protein kinase
MAFPPTIPKSALDKYTPIKFISQSANGYILACIRKSNPAPTLSSLLALNIPPTENNHETLLRQLKCLREIDSRRVTSVIDYDPRGNWYIASFHHGQNLRHLKETLLRDGFPPFLVCKIFVEVIAAQNTELEPKGICHEDLRASHIILSPTTKEELPYVRIMHLEGIAVWNEEAVVKQIMILLRYLTNGEARIPDQYRTKKKGARHENSWDVSLEDGDDFYSFIAGYDLEEQMSWKELRSRWTNLAGGLMWELYDKGRLADVREVIGEEKVTFGELDKAVKDGGMDVIVDRAL